LKRRKVTFPCLSSFLLLGHTLISLKKLSVEHQRS
jgi:hypothetical protein